MNKFSKENVIYNFEYGMKEKYRVKPKEKFIVETCDCFHEQIKSEEQVLMEIDMDIVNPATGPIYIENAMPGDILKVNIINIEIKDKGVAAAIPNAGGLAEESKEAIVRVIEVKDGYANYLGKKIPISPMIGVIGLAPAIEDGKWGTHTPWKHGGNMDSTVIGKGSSLYFQVQQEGAMLALGDLHAVMGDGELCFTGLEISGEVELEVEVIKTKRKLKWPIVELDDRIEIIASGESLDEATKEAASTAVDLMKDALKISWAESYVLASLVMDLKISQIVNPKKTARAAIPKNIVTIKELL